MIQLGRHFKIRRFLPAEVSLPLLVFLVVTSVGIYAHFRFIELEAQSVRALSSRKLDSLQDQFSQAVEDRIRSLERMAQRLEYSSTPDHNAWLADAETYRKHLKGLDSIAVLDTKDRFKWISAQSPIQAKELKSLDPKLIESVVYDSHDQRRVVVSRRLREIDSSAIFLIVVPLFHENRWVGSLISVNRLEPFLKSFFRLKGYEVEVREGSEILFSNKDISQDRSSRWSDEISMPVFNRLWFFRIAPTDETIHSQESNLPLISLVSALLSGLLLAAIINLTLRLRLRSKAIENQRRFLDTVIDNLPVAVFCRDHENGFRFSVWNKKCEEIFGVQKPGIIGRTSVDVFGSSVPQTLLDSKDLAGADVSFDETIGSEKFGPVLLHTRKIDIHDGHTKPIYTLGISEDVTSRRAAEVALMDSEQKFVSFMENTPELTWIRNEKGEFTFVNSKFCEAFGISKDQLIGSPSIPGVPLAVQEQGAKNDQQVRKELNNVSSVQPITTADGRHRHFLVLKFPMQLASGVQLVGATAIDITDRIDAENVLAQTTKTLRALIDSSPLPIFTLDLDGRVKVWSPACEKTFGWTAAEAEGGPLPFVPVEKREESRKIIAKIISAGAKGFSADATRVRKDGSSIEMHIEGMVLNDDTTGAPSGLVAVMNDISQQKLAEKNLQDAKEKAENTAKIKAEFLANVSHEIRTPLNGIIGMTDILIESGLSEEQKKYAKIVQNSGGILLNLINDILDLSKIEAGKMTLEKTGFSPLSLVESNTDLLIAKAREKGLSLMTHIDTDIPSQVIGDPARIAQVLVNLIGNAIKFTSKGGVSIRVSRDQLPPGTDRSRVMLKFEVKDTGIGLSAASREKLFQPFTQAESSTTRRFGGTGLGLSISKNLIDAMGGTIGVDSQFGLGSTFWFSIPLDAAIALNFSAVRKTKGFEKKRALIIDEDAIATDVIQRYLANWDFKNVKVASHQDGLAEIREAQILERGYHLVLIGQDSNGTRSHQLAREIQFELGGRAPKIILMTPFETQLPSAVAKGSDFDAFISKPLKQSQLFDCIWKVLVDPLQKITELPLQTKIPHEPTGETGAPLHVLVADDVSTNQIIAIKILENLGHTAHAVANGLEAVEAVKLRHYDIILMDCQMPELDGFGATKAIRDLADPTKSRTTIIALTANAMNGDREQCLAAGMNDYLSKPIKKDQLKAMLNRWSPVLKKHG